ncbi:MAG: hypothetical protein KBT04_01130 [Bacteroidales bacterium]|nr:hypothetical protein [Candidatus Colimorpha onthohippi]
MKIVIKMVSLLLLLALSVSCSTNSTDATVYPDGCLPGMFSVSPTKTVQFSQGNLQYSNKGSHQCADGTTKPGDWRFAAHQYDYVGNDNANINSSYAGWIDLFGWGTSGYNGCEPYLSSMDESDFGSLGVSDLVDSNANYDWGVYNTISNGGNGLGKWRMLTHDEWTYLCFTRPNASSKCGNAIVNGMRGVVFLPDNWTLPTGCTFTSGNGSGWTTNDYTATQWLAMESAGAVFLPTAGYRQGSTVIYAGGDGYYWSSTASGGSGAFILSFGKSYLSLSGSGRFYGFSVRLVRDCD